ncbi:hypothetical protein HU200_058222 [Digitaria exilis]|uniref:F-box domain-containing protein n=1 Tax=Digitaria exilis TaxID=1010633 RepID=A0A835ACV1_9POAL|nr:hypothetical protein HU200_058222 [Digitaria exilis]
MPSTSATTLSPPPPATGSAGLPRDVLWSIFVRLGQHEVLQSTSLACAAWWCFARGVDLTPPAVDVARPLCFSDHSDDDCSIGDWMFDEAAAADDGGQEEHRHCVMGWKAMARAAVDRSAGQCEAFCGRADDDVLLYLADR